MVRYATVCRRDCAGWDPEIVEEILMDLITQPDIVAAEECGPDCLKLNFKGAQYRIDNLPFDIAQKIPALVRKVGELSQMPY